MTVNTSLASKFKKRIKKVAPWAQNIEINVQKNSDGIYRTAIEVTAKSKTFYAKKLDSSIQQALDRSFHAIIKQLGRYRINRLHHTTKKALTA